MVVFLLINQIYKYNYIKEDNMIKFYRKNLRKRRNEFVNRINTVTHDGDGLANVQMYKSIYEFIGLIYLIYY